MTPEKADQIANDLQQTFKQTKFTIKIEPLGVILQVKALTEFFPVVDNDLRELAKIIEGHCLTFKRSGNKVKLTIW